MFREKKCRALGRVEMSLGPNVEHFHHRTTFQRALRTLRMMVNPSTRQNVRFQRVQIAHVSTLVAAVQQTNFEMI